MTMGLVIVLALLALILGLFLYYWFLPERVFFHLRNHFRRRGKLTERRVRVGAHDWPYLEGGPADAPVLLMVHGFGGEKDNWAMIAPYLTGEYRLIAPDQLGFGDNARIGDAPYDIVSQTERLVQFMDALGLARAHVAGNSMGGWIALELALSHPDRVQTLTLVNNAGIITPRESELAQAAIAGGNPLQLKGPDDLDRLMAFVTHKPRYVPGRFKRVIWDLRAPHGPLLDQIFWTIVDDGLNRPMNDRLAGVRAPTLVIWGRHDRLIDVSAVEVLEAGIAHAETMVFDHVGHVPMLEDPAATARVLTAFLAKHR